MKKGHDRRVVSFSVLRKVTHIPYGYHQYGHGRSKYPRPYCSALLNPKSIVIFNHNSFLLIDFHVIGFSTDGSYHTGIIWKI